MARDPVKPNTDGKVVWDIIFYVTGLPAVFVSHDLGLFEVLDDSPASLSELAGRLGIAERPLEALLAINTSMGLLAKKEGLYSLTQVAEEYLTSKSDCYMGGPLELISKNDFSTSISALKNAVSTNSAQTYGDGELFKSHQDMAEEAKVFTRAMHGFSMAPALHWPSKLDLSSSTHFLDIGGGSGAHTVGVLSRWKQMRGTLFDLAPICEVARETFLQYALQDRADTSVGDLWGTEFPEADVHFYSQIFHDWPREKCEFLAKKSFRSLSPGGRILIHEILYTDDRSKPLAAAASSIGMLLWTEGKQYSGKEIMAMLQEAGFVDIEVVPTYADWSVVSGRKR